MDDQNYVLITRQRKSPVLKKVIGHTCYGVIRLLDECAEREEADQEIRTVCCYEPITGEIDVWSEKQYRTIFGISASDDEVR